jgi:hypothetical protein
MVGNPNQPRDTRGRWTTQSALGLAVTLTVALGVAGVGTSGSAGSAGSAGSSARSGSSNSIKARNRDFSKIVARLEQRGRQVERLEQSLDGDCARNSYGRVQAYFAERPCSALVRAVFEVKDSGRATAVVAVAVVDMPDSTQAGQFKRLVDSPGTGNITELRGSRSVSYTGEHYASAQDGSTVVNAQAEPVGRTAAALRLAEIVAGSAASP